MALFADVIKLIEAERTTLHTQLGALQLQQRRGTGPAGLRPRPCTHLTGMVTFLTAGALSVIPERTHETIHTNKSGSRRFLTLQTLDVGFLSKSVSLLNGILEQQKYKTAEHTTQIN